MSSYAQIIVSSDATLTLSAANVIPVLGAAVSGTGTAVAAQVTLSDLATYFTGGAANQFKSTTAIATPAAFTVTTFDGFASTVYGAALMGYGTTNDATLFNRAGTPVLGVVANSTAVTLAGTLAVAGVTATFGAAGAANTIAGTTTALTANAASGATTFTANVGTGTGAVGGMVFQVPITHGSDSVAQTLTTVLTLSATTTVSATFANAATVTGTFTVGGAITTIGATATQHAWGAIYKVLEISSGSGLMSRAVAELYAFAGVFYDGTNFKYTNSSAATYYAQESGVHTWFTVPSGTAGNTATPVTKMMLDAVATATYTALSLYINDTASVQRVQSISNAAITTLLGSAGRLLYVAT